MQEEILALSLDKVDWYKSKLELWHHRQIWIMTNEVKAGLEVEINKIRREG